MNIPMKPSFLRLDSYFIEELRFKANRGYEYTTASEVQPSDLQVAVAGNNDSDASSEWVFRLTISLDDTKGARFPYAFMIVLVGFFRIREDQPLEDAEGRIQTNAPAILYSAARDAIASTTSRGPYPCVVLPSVSFIESLNKQQLADEEKKQLETSKDGTEEALKLREGWEIDRGKI